MFFNFGREYRRKRTRIFADKTLFKRNSRITDSKQYYLPDEDTYQTVTGTVESGSLPITTFSPDLRGDDLKLGVEFYFKMLEKFCGFSGVLTDIQSVDLATATAIRASMHSTFAFISTLRKRIENAIEDLTDATVVIYNSNNDSAIFDYQVDFSWDDSLMENSAEAYNMLINGLSLDIVSKAEVRSWLMNEKLETAKEKISELENEAV